MTLSVIAPSSSYSKDDSIDEIVLKTVFIEYSEFGKVFRNRKIYSKRLEKGEKASTELRDFLTIGNAERGPDYHHTHVINPPLNLGQMTELRATFHQVSKGLLENLCSVYNGRAWY
jgi:hypothetical protein